MSAYGIGADSASFVGTSRTNTADTNAPATIVKWIPGEAITFYATVLGAGAAQGAPRGDETPQQLLERIDAASPQWFLCAVVVALALVVLGALTAPRPVGQKLSALAVTVRAGLTLLALALWTSALPGSWPYSWEVVRDLGPAGALILVPAGIVFAGLAELLTKRTSL